MEIGHSTHLLDLAIVSHDLAIVNHDLAIVSHDLAIVSHDLAVVSFDRAIVAYLPSDGPRRVEVSPRAFFSIGFHRLAYVKVFDSMTIGSFSGCHVS